MKPPPKCAIFLLFLAISSASSAGLGDSQNLSSARHVFLRGISPHSSKPWSHSPWAWSLFKLQTPNVRNTASEKCGETCSSTVTQKNISSERLRKTSRKLERVSEARLRERSRNVQHLSEERLKDDLSAANLTETTRNREISINAQNASRARLRVNLEYAENLSEERSRESSKNAEETSSGEIPYTNRNFVFRVSRWKGVLGSLRIPDLNMNKVSWASILVLWLVILLYLLGTTASDYFSYSLEKLSLVLNLSPPVAGATLLAVGNGAPDVFASVVAFMSSDESGSIGFTSVLGGALFISTVVTGSIALATISAFRKRTIPREADERAMLYGKYEHPVVKHTETFIRIDGNSFVRDAVFLLAAIGALAVLLLDGEIHLWEAVIFLCVYPVYILSVWVTQLVDTCHKQRNQLLEPMLVEGNFESYIPQWTGLNETPENFQQVHGERSVTEKIKHHLNLFYIYCIQWPFDIPRRLTIPVVEEDRWSRPLAITSCSLSPIFVAGVWILEYSRESIPLVLVISGVVGFMLGVIAFLTTENERPPRQCLWMWLGGGFLLSIIWFYLVADELVATLESLGVLFDINPAVLGLTILAWGNSVGDLMANLSLAQSSPEGAQIAVSGCYAGPLFNTTIGLGISLLVGCLKSRPEPLCITDLDSDLFYIIGFLAAGLIWGLVIMPLRGMKLTRSFGVGLIFLYGSFLVVGLCYATGLLP